MSEGSIEWQAAHAADKQAELLTSQRERGRADQQQQQQEAAGEAQREAEWSDPAFFSGPHQ